MRFEIRQYLTQSYDDNGYVVDIFSADNIDHALTLVTLEPLQRLRIVSDAEFKLKRQEILRQYMLYF